MSPLSFWNGFARQSSLYGLAIHVLSLPASTAAVERSFSRYKNVHSTIRNRLTTTRAGKLVWLAHNLPIIAASSRCERPPVRRFDTSHDPEIVLPTVDDDIDEESGSDYDDDDDVLDSTVRPTLFRRSRPSLESVRDRHT